MSNIVGIDIGVGTIKAVSLNKNGDQITLEDIGEIKTPNVVWLKGEGKTAGMKEVAGAIKKLMTDMKSKARQAVVCLPEDELISRIIDLPPLKETEVMDALRFEAETFVPYPLDQVTMDFEVIEKDDNGRLKIFVVAARNELIETYVKLFKMTGLELAALESPSVALRRIVNLSINKSVGSLIIVDFGDNFSDITGFNKGNICFTRSMPMGGESLTRAISINLGLDMASAEEYKKAYGMNGSQLEGKIRNAILPIFTNMTEEIRKSVTLFAEEHGKSIELLSLSGGGANLPGLAEELAKLMGIEVQVLQPFTGIDISKATVTTSINTDGCRYSYALGLALKNFI